MVEVFHTWLKDFQSSLQKKDGWKLFFQIILVLFTGIGILYTNLTFQTNKQFQRQMLAENSFLQFNSNLGTPESKTKRIGVILSIPDLLKMESPVKTNIGALEAIFLTLHPKKNSDNLYSERIKERYFGYVKSMTEQNELWSIEEMETIINSFKSIGIEGWYNSNKVLGEDQYLSWIWKYDYLSTQKNYVLSTIFEGLKFDRISFSDINLSSAKFSSSSLQNCKFSNSNMKNINVSNANLSYSILFNNYLENVNFNHTISVNSVYSYANIVGDYNDFKTSNLDSSFFHNSVISNCYFEEKATLCYSRFQNDTIKESSFRDSKFNKSKIINCWLRNVNMSNVDLSDTYFELVNFRDMKFNNSNLSNVVFDNCSFNSVVDFSSAKISGITFINIQDISSLVSNPKIIWNDATINNIKGLTPSQINILIQKGAKVKRL